MARFYFIIAVTYVAADKWQLTYYGVKISHLKGGGLGTLPRGPAVVQQSTLHLLCYNLHCVLFIYLLRAN